MDNLTHTLAGLALGHAADQSRPKKDRGRMGRTLWFASALSNNIPDFDFLYAGITPGKLGYLLHHRGHTHTFMMAIPQALLLLALFYAWFRFRKTRLTRGDWLWLSFVIFLGPLIHIGLDYGNSYGVHPFWPFDNRWYYGDSVFILEPWLWISLAPSLLFGARAVWAKALFAVIFLTALGLCFFTGYVPWQMALIVGLWGLWLLGLMTKIAAPARVYSGLAAFGLVLTLFYAVALHAKSGIKQILKIQFPATSLHDLAISPLPANPLCWNIHTVETMDQRYIVRRGTYAVAPNVIAAVDCPRLLDGGRTAPMVPVPTGVRPYLVWFGQYESRLSELRELSTQRCGVAALLRFTRVPYWTNGDAKSIIGDLRFDRRPGLDFAEIAGGPEACPKFVPPWIPPREDILTRLETSASSTLPGVLSH